MKVSNEKVVSIHYTLKNDAGEILDSSEGQAPLSYLQGRKNIIPGLEKSLEGKVTGDKVQAVIQTEDAYGAKRDELIQSVPRSAFQDAGEIKVGAQFQLQTEQGPVIAKVVDSKDDSVTLDMNHPLAGETLHFDVEVTEVREATDEELAHGHVHGPDDHHH